MKSLAISSLVLALAMAMPTGSAMAKDGIYKAEVTGHNAPMSVEVTIKNGKIAKIDTSKNLETVGVGRVALDRLTDSIIKNQSVRIDAISGATITSFALLGGVRDTLKQAGINLKDFSKVVKTPALPKTHYTADVIVIGGGGSGLASAIAAEQAGARVIVLEKLGINGGSTNVSEGALNAPDAERQVKQGIEDSTEKFFYQTFKGGHYIGNPLMVDKLTEESINTVHWMEKLGVNFKPEVGTATGALWQRSHYPTTPSGNSYIRVYEKYVAGTNGRIQIMNNVTAKSLIEDKKGRIVGVEANNLGQKVVFNAKNGVIVATGGFGANIKLRQEVNDGVWKEVMLDKSIGCTNFQKSAQGEGIMMAKNVKANIIGMSDIQIHPCGTPGTGLMENIRTSGRNRLFVNSDGARFVNEGAPRDTLAKAIFAQKDSTYWVLVNHLRYPSRDFVDRNGATIANMVALGSVVEANTLPELAKKTGMNPKALKASIDGYNKVVRGETKDKLGFLANNKADRELTEGPWYACKKVPTVHHTMGGIEIDVMGRVLNVEGKPIKGLYAAGETTGGIHGSNRLGGNAIADIMTFGRIAGTNAAHNK